jgi:hypothetical protein
MGKIRVNKLAAELKVTSKSIIECLVRLGVTGKRSHSSAVEDEIANKVRAAGAGNLELHLTGVGQRNVVSLSLKNTGNTPAKLVETAILYRKVDRLESIPKGRRR